jgi:hypothetical protein
MEGTDVLATILFIVLIALYVFFFFAVIRAGTKGILSWLTAFGTAILGLLIVIYLFINIEDIEPADWAQILPLLGLVAVTGFYAWRTHVMSQEMREQRLGEARPYLLLRLQLEQDELIQWDDYQSSKPQTEFPVTIINAGKGPAKNLKASLWSPEISYFGENKGYLVPGEEWQVNISRDSTDAVESGIEKEAWLPELKKEIKQEYPGVIAVEYTDIHHRVWVSYLCLERHDIRAFVFEAEQDIVELKKKS